MAQQQQSVTFTHKQWFVVNSDLKLSTGKISAQIGHGAVHWAVHCMENKDEDFKKWFHNHQPKIILQEKESGLRRLLQLYPTLTYPVVDTGKTECKPGSLTVVAFKPLPLEKYPPELAGLSLLKERKPIKIIH